MAKNAQAEWTGSLKPQKAHKGESGKENLPYKYQTTTTTLFAPALH